MDRSGKLRLKRLLIDGAGEMPEGAYNLRDHTRSVSIGQDARSAEARMASLHESYHAYLNETTGYGVCMILAGALAKHDPKRFDGLLMGLLDSAFDTHEAFATAASVYVAASGTFDQAVLQEYPIYQDHFASWEPFIEQAPHPVLAYLAIENISRAAFQTNLAGQWAAIPAAKWRADLPSATMQPDARRAALLSPGFAKILYRIHPDPSVEGAEELADFIGGDIPLPDFKRRFLTGGLDPAIDNLGHAYFRAAQHRLKTDGGQCLDFNGHRLFTEALIERAAEVVGPSIHKHYRAPKGDENELELLVGDFANERLIFSENPYPAIYLTADDLEPAQVPDLLTGSDDERWVQIVAMPKAKALHLYRFDAESSEALAQVPGDTITAIRRRIVHPETLRLQYIELVGVPEPEVLKGLAETWDDLTAVVPIVTLSAMEDETWRELWLDRLASLGPVPILVDRDPFHMMRRWRDGSFKADTARISMEARHLQPLRRFEVFCWFIEGSGLVFFSPTSGTVAGALTHAARSMPEVFNETTNFLTDQQALLTKAICHVLFEESMVGFGFWV